MISAVFVKLHACGLNYIVQQGSIVKEASFATFQLQTSRCQGQTFAMAAFMPMSFSLLFFFCLLCFLSVSSSFFLSFFFHLHLSFLLSALAFLPFSHLCLSHSYFVYVCFCDERVQRAGQVPTSRRWPSRARFRARPCHLSTLAADQASAF